MPALMLFGDSLTELGWQPGGLGQRLAEVYSRKLDVVNRGFSGYNTEWAIPVFEQCFSSQGVRLLTIWLGGNDSCLEFSPQHVPLNKYSKNLHRLVQMVKSPSSPLYSPDTAVILLTPPPVDTYQRNASLSARDPPIKLDRHFDVTKSYAEAVKNVGLRENIPIVDVWSVIFDAANQDEHALGEYLCDGLHLSATGYQLVFDALMKTISDHYPELHYDNVPPVFPPWKEINWNDPISSLKKKESGGPSTATKA